MSCFQEFRDGFEPSMLLSNGDGSWDTVCRDCSDIMLQSAASWLRATVTTDP